MQEDLQLLREQVDRCKQTISQILASTGQGRDEICVRWRSTPTCTVCSTNGRSSVRTHGSA
jgi:hypothetical protein